MVKVPSVRSIKRASALFGLAGAACGSLISVWSLGERIVSVGISIRSQLIQHEITIAAQAIRLEKLSDVILLGQADRKVENAVQTEKIEGVKEDVKEVREDIGKVDDRVAKIERSLDRWEYQRRGDIPRNDRVN